MDKKYVIFDMDGTLLDSMPYWFGLDRDFLKMKGIPLPATYEDDVAGFTMHEVIRYMIDVLGVQETEEEIRALTMAAMDTHYREHVELKPGVREYLDYLKDNGVRMTVATLTAMSLTRPALEKHGLLEYFEDIFTCSDLGLNKRTPEVYLMAAERMGAKPHETAVFEDTPESLLTAHAAGFCTVLVHEEVLEDLQREIADTADWFCRDMNELRTENLNLLNQQDTQLIQRK